MNDVKETIEKLNLKPLNITDNSLLKYKYNDGIESWRYTTKIVDIECKIEIFFLNDCIQIYLLPEIPCNSETLKKINDVNVKNWGCGISCYMDSDSNSIALKTTMLDYTINSKETIIKILNLSIPSAIQVVKALIT